ncbi:glycosyltransferase [Halarcobacter sp.]|uniref:glycosyltransferase n=1 Tax=Halarcobacter sp. TaxID=2321133 RepID=UPI003B00C9B7
MKNIIIYFQILLLTISYNLFRIFIKKDKKKHWVIGVNEIASNIYFLGNVLKPSKTINFSKNKFYNLNYDYYYDVSNKLKYFFWIIYSPILFGYLTSKYNKFWYIWNTGFLVNRNFEFKFLKYKNKKIVCMFVGDDIRSIKLTRKFAKDNNIDIFANYYGNQKMFFLSDKYDLQKKEIALTADNYADVIFNHKVCQISYLKSNQYSWPYMYDKYKFYKDNTKFIDIITIKIVHAPTNPINKGTQLVRAAIKKLELENYDINYIEIQDMPNKIVLEHLRSAHIVLNQFYAFTPGLFGIEAMANHCAVLMSANPDIEKGLPKEGINAWMITNYWQIYDNLKVLLDNPTKIKYYADNGYSFAYKYYTFESARNYIKKVLNENGIN